MRAEIIGIGTEILLGQIANSNAQWMSERLADVGVDVLHHQAVGDNVERIADAIRLALSRADVVICTGGLGPTQDDVTRQAIAEVLGVPLVRHREIEDLLRAKFERFRPGVPMPEANVVQAEVPEGCRYVLPERGTAPGLACPAGERMLYAVAGVPAEMREMMHGTILPELGALAGPAAIVSSIVRATGIPESAVSERLDDLFHASTNPTLAFLATSGEVRVRLTAKAPTRAEAEALIRPVVEEVARRLGGHVFSQADEELEQVVGRLLRATRRSVACGESLTGGGLASRLTAAPGASEYFLGSAVCYTEDAKVRVLGVSRATLDGPGVVSRECALEMAAGARSVFQADVGLALTGVAGPGPHGGQPPGQVWTALSAEGTEVARGFRAPGDRDQVRRWAEQAALDLLRRFLDGTALPD